MLDEDAGEIMNSIDRSNREYDRSCASNGKQQPLFRRLLMMIFGWFDLQIQRRHSRRVLLELSDEQLKDIGLSRHQIDWKSR